MRTRVTAATLLALVALLPASASAQILPTSPLPVPTQPLQPINLPLLCASPFSDVQPGNPFYDSVSWLYCHAVVNGYSDGTFHPYDDITRAQLVKWIVLFRAWPSSAPTGGSYTFADVPPAYPFFAYIETAAKPGIISGYTCGGFGEPCDALSRPYFRPGEYVNRAQALKILVSAEAWPLIVPATATFADVPAGTAFYPYIETAFARGLVSGYACGGPQEPCDSLNRPYFRPFQAITRGQAAKILYLSR